MITEILDKLPMWGVLLATLAVAFFAINAGFRLGTRRRERLVVEETPRIGSYVTAAFSLLAFMIAIVFGAVESRFDERKHVALGEANAIGTAYLRADLLDKANRADIRKFLYEYVTLRIEASQDGNEQKLQLAIDKSEALQGEMWSRAVALVGQQPTPISALFMQSLNEVIDFHEKRLTIGIHYRMAGIIWIVLYSLAIIAMMMGGFDSGLLGGGRVTTINLLAALSFSAVLTLTVALDRPWQHLSQVTQKAMIDVQEDIRRSMQLKY